MLATTPEQMREYRGKLRRLAEEAVEAAKSDPMRTKFGAVNWARVGVGGVDICQAENDSYFFLVRVDDANSPALQTFIQEYIGERFDEVSNAVDVFVDW